MNIGRFMTEGKVSFTLLLSVICVIASCSKETDARLPESVILEECRQILGSGYVKTDNGIIECDATFDDIRELGVHEESWIKFQEDIRLANGFLSESGDEAELEICMAGVNESSACITKVGSDPSGTITTTDSGAGEDYFNAPNGVIAIYCYCFSSSAASIYIVETSAAGGVNMKRRVGYGELVVPVAASNCGVHIRFWTSNSNGGTCGWSCLYTSDSN